MRILITGATGFVGGWLADELVQQYPDAVLTGTSHRSTGNAHLPEGMTVSPVDFTDPAQTRNVVSASDPDMVFHLAGFASGGGTDRDRIFQANADGTRHLLEALIERGKPCRTLLTSSGYVYGPTAPGRPAQESDALNPLGPYPESKAAMEETARIFSASPVLSLTVVRAFNHTGPRQTSEFVIPAFARQIARIEKGLEPPVVRHGNLDALRDFLDVRDVVRAYRLLVCELAPESYRVVNVASGKGVTVRGLLEQLIGMATVSVTHETDPARMRPSDLPECVGDPSLLTALTGWTPTIPLTETLTRTLAWWREQENKTDAAE